MKSIRKRISLFLAFTLILTSFALISVSASASSAWPNDGIVNPGTGTWWTSSIRWEQYAPDEGPYLPRAAFSLDSIDVIVKGEEYTVPAKTFQYDVILANYDYETNKTYRINVMVNYNGTAQYVVDEMWSGNVGEVYYNDTYAIIPIVGVYTDNNGQMFQAEEGIVDPGVSSWWTSSIKWEQYAPGIDPYFPRAAFSLDSIDINCYGGQYNVPAKTFQYDVILANYDYETNKTYRINAKINYNGSAQYVLDENWYGNEREVYYFDTYAIVPIIGVYTDNDGQMLQINDGVVSSEVGYDTSIRWEQYAPGIDPYFPRSTFSLDSIDIVCRGEEMTVPARNFYYDVIFADYDYETNRNYDICVYVDYSTNTASYILDEEASGRNQISYFTDHAIIPIYQAYSDADGQLFVYGSPLY